MKKNLLLLLPIVALFLPACKSSKPYDSSAGTGTYDGDYTDMSELPQRGDFNPDQDVDYSTFRAGGKENGTIYFATDSSTIAPSERGKLDRIATWLFQNTSKSILIAGHCDERGTLEYNRALGEQRATSVRAYLIGLGVAANRIYTHSYGEEKPAVPGANEAAYQKNRRAEIGVVMK
ncbi:MAG: OmpA family protein [Verrucomicrobiae bacterium]|nr:OmpA family protein [Verrucomicrobiae bacterium]